MQATIESNWKDYDDIIKKLTEDLTEMITSMMYEIKILTSSPDNNYSPKPQDPTTVIQSNKKSPPLEGGHSTKIGGIWNIKY